MKEDWTRRSFRLKDRHGWKSKPGYAICAIDRGAIRFDYPEGWRVRPEPDSLSIRDPEDNCILAVSQMRLPPELADQFPLKHLVLVSSGGDKRKVLIRGEVIEVPRADGVELAHIELRHFDPKEKREAISRLAVARGSGVYCLMTFDFWVDDTNKYVGVWEEALRSLTLGLYITDPTVGPVMQ
jgi:hypothetical protein